MENQPSSLSKMAVPHIMNENIILEEVMTTHDPDGKDFNTSFIFNFVKKILYPTMTAGKTIHEDEEFDEEDSNDEESDEEESDKDKESDEEESNKDKESDEDESDKDKESDEEESDKDKESDEEESDKDKESDEEESNHKVFDEKEPNDEEPKDMELPYQIKRFSFEMSLKCSNNMNPHSTVIYFLKMLSTYSWEAKLLMMLAAFSLNFGEFSLVHGQKGLAGKLAILKGSESKLVPMVTHFIKSVLHLTKCIVELAQSSSYNSSPIILIACYWIVRSVLTYASYFTCLTSVHSRWFIVEETQLSSLTAKIKYVISDCRPILEEKREEDSYKALWHAFSDENPIPSANLDVFKLLFNVKKGGKKKPIYDGGEMVELRSSKDKSLLLLISSSLDIDNDLVLILRYLQRKIRLRVLWIPILDCPALWAIKHMKKQYKSLVNKGELLSVRNVQKSIAPGFVRFVKEKFFPTFRIGGEPIIVSLDHHGRMVHHNAMHMVLMRVLDICERMSGGVKTRESIIPLLQNVLKERTLAVRDLVPDIDRKIEETAVKMDRIMIDWLHGIEEQIQNPVYSNIFTSEREKDLWKTETWCTNLVVGGLGQQITKWVENNMDIFLIGGNNIKWVKTFVSNVMLEIRFNPQSKIKMVYVGSNMNVASMINRDKVCEAPDESPVFWFFWARLRSIFLSRIKFLDETHCNEECDEIVEGLKKLLAYEAKNLAVDGWAMLCKGNKIVVCDLGDKMLTVMNEYKKWKESAIANSFDQAFKDHHEMLDSTHTSQYHPYFALEYPFNFDKVPKNVKCPQCCQNMQKFVTFRCCHDIVDDEDAD